MDRLLPTIAVIRSFLRPLRREKLIQILKEQIYIAAMIHVSPAPFCDGKWTILRAGRLPVEKAGQ
jgi:hypothetical protein